MLFKPLYIPIWDLNSPGGNRWDWVALVRGQGRSRDCCAEVFSMPFGGGRRSWRWPVGSFNSFNPCVGNSEQPPSRDLNVGRGPVLVFVGNARDHKSPRSKKGRWAHGSWGGWTCRKAAEWTG